MFDKINSKMSIGTRLALVSGLFVASSVVGGTVLFGNATTQIDFSKKEEAGAAYLGNVWSAIRSGGAVDQADAEPFNASAAASSFLGAQSHTERIAAGLTLITAVADGSNLTLDPDLDSFYAMDAATVKIPAMLSAALELETVVASTGADRDILLNVAANRLEGAASLAAGSMEAAIANNASGETRGALSESVSTIKSAASDLIAAARAAAPGAALDTQLATFAASTDETWRATATELSRLLGVRIAAKQSELTMQMALVAVLLAIAGALAFLVSTGLARRFKGLTEAMDRMREGQFKVDVPYTDDGHETGKIASTLLFMRDGMAERAVQDAEVVAERERAAAAQIEAEERQQQFIVDSIGKGLIQLAAGDLTARIEQEMPPAYKQLQTNFNTAMTNLQDAMKSIVVNAGGIRSGAGEISQASDDLSRRTEQQAASLEETAAALDEITATVRKTADGSKQANSVVATTRSDAEASGRVVQDTVAAMAEIEKSSKQISQIIGVIDEIAFQTNLLALNAGVEAARAGDAGRGFAVVASEVRALAQRSSEAAKEIKGLISASSQHVETGVELVGDAGKALQGIVAKVNEISGLVSEIAASAQEQATALAEVNTAINQMDQVTQQNAAMVEESTAASHSLTQEAAELMNLVGRFETGAPPAAQAGAARGHAKAGAKHKAPGQPIQQQKQRVAQFAGSAALKSGGGGDDWQDF